jgi:uncharacterized protein (TIGR02171 family)
MKKTIVLATAFLSGVLLESCSDDSPTQMEMGSTLVCSSQENCSGVTLQDGLALIRSSGKYAEMGTNSTSAKPNERPQMDAKFTYDFQIGKHEVTCGEFNALMDKKNGVKLSCENANLPAVNVTYYDAVLFANAKSKAAGMDSAYMYSSAEFDKNGHCILLNGLVFKPEVDAFRLPTEAEWIYAAGLSFNVDNSWNADNSGSKVHEVCSKKNENGLCDFLGNVTEWVNDWLGNFRDTSITNYVGGVDGGSLGERVIKGGSYRTEPSLINLYARGDVYTVTGTSAADYLGFRLAYGNIENPVWLDASGAAVASNLSIVASAKNISSLFGTYKSKLVFRNNNSGNLAFVDFRRVSPSIIEIKDSIDVYHPDISPDGKHVAFCTGLEGVSGSSSVYVRDLNAEGSNLVKLDVKNAAIPRWRVLENGDTVIVYVSDAGNNKDESNFKSTSTWQVKFANGKFGEPQKLFDGAYHGGISEDESLTVTGARVLRARIAAKGSTVKSNAKDTLWYNGDQACNASLNKKTKRTLFLDFAKSGGETMGSKFVGSSYRTHERLLIADNEGKLVSTVASPSGYTFDHSEWVLNDENVAVVTLTNVDGAHEKIVLVNTKDSSLTTLVEGDDVWHPCFWVLTGTSSGASNWDEDSVGVYVSAANQTDYLLSHKMPMFWKLKDSIEFIGLGSSRMWAGLAPSEMSVPTMNMGFYPCDMHCQHYFFKNYVLNHVSNIKYVVIGLDFDLWFNYDPRAAIEWDMGGALGFEYDIKHEFYPDGVDDAFVNIVMENAPADAEEIIAKRGWQEIFQSIGWVNESGAVDMSGDSAWSDCLFNKNLGDCLEDSDLNTCTSQYHNVCFADTSLNKCLNHFGIEQCSAVFSGNLEKLKDFVRLAKERNIIVIGAIFPMSPNYKNTGSYGRHGMLRSHAKKLIEVIKTWAEGKSNFVVFDENKFGDHDYPSSMSYDVDHLNRDGAKRFTTRLDSLLKTVR